MTRIYTASQFISICMRFAYFVTIGQSIDWRDPIGFQKFYEDVNAFYSVNAPLDLDWLVQVCLIRVRVKLCRTVALSDLLCGI